MLVLISIILSFVATFVSAEDDNPFDITLYGSFLHTANVPNALFFFNDIEQYDSFEFRRALRNHDVEIVVLASDGGNVFESLNMAGIINDRGLATYVPTLPEEMGCYSACAFMFLAGKIRQADGILAMHQTGNYGASLDSSQRKVSEVQQTTQYTISEIIGFLNEFETPPWVYEKMLRSRDFYVFDEDEKKRLASRDNELRASDLYNINGFARSFVKYLETLEQDSQIVDKNNTIKPNSKEQISAIVEIQRLLNNAGCRAGVEDGIWGRKTEAAAVLFARTAKLPTSQEELISEDFITKLRMAPANYCPKQVVQKQPNKEKKIHTKKSILSCGLDYNENYEQNLLAYDYKDRTEEKLNDVRSFSVSNDIITMGSSELKQKDNGAWVRHIQVLCEDNDNNWSPCGSIYGKVTIKRKDDKYSGVLHIPYEWSTGGNVPVVKLSYSCK